IIEDGELKNIEDGEFGHNMMHVSTPNIHNTFAHDMFKSVLENASQGIRGKQLFKVQQTTNQATNLTLLSQIQHIR
ncbi:MAG: hypothetical protein J6Y91_05525, partial [Alphaproteobacteria bacterium]|nr:hypothetical protein [Alphaproteobacteria bacterium]